MCGDAVWNTLYCVREPAGCEYPRSTVVSCGVSIKMQRNDRQLPVAIVNVSAELTPYCPKRGACDPPLCSLPPSLPRGGFR